MTESFLHPAQVRKYFECRLPAFNWNGHAQVSARCPFHDDSNASFSINSDEGRWSCHAGCGSGGILAFEEKFSACDHEQAKANLAALLGISFGPEPEAIYNYWDALGAIVFRKLRYSGKKFVCQQPAENGKGWINGLNGISVKPLYNLPQLIRATYAIVCEGEKDADRLTAMNLSQYCEDRLPLAVTTNYDGAGHWRSEYGPSFANKQVTILSDNDPIGRDHAAACAAGIQPYAAGVKLVHLPGLPLHGDVSDYLDAGHTAEELLAEIEKAPRWLAERAESAFESVIEVLARSPEKAEFVFSRHVERSSITGWGAKIKYGKSSICMSGMKTVLEGATFLGYPSVRGPVVLITEMTGSAFVAAVERAGLRSCEGLRVLQQHKTFGMTWPQIVAAAAAECRRTNAVLLAIDTLSQFAGLTEGQEQDSSKMMEVLRYLQQVKGQGFGILYLMHDRKAGGEVADAARGSCAAGGCADIVISMGKPEGNHRSETIRKVSAVGRFAETPNQIVVDWTIDNEYVVLGDSDAVTRDRATAAIMAALPLFQDSAKTVKVLKEETGEPESTIRRILRQLRAKREGDGEKNNPFRYWWKGSGGQ